MLSRAHSKLTPPASAFLWSLAIAVLVNLVVSRPFANVCARLTPDYFADLASAKQFGKPAIWWVARGYFAEPSAPDVVLFGSSQTCVMQAADAEQENRPIDFALDRRSAMVEEALRREVGRSCTVVSVSHPGAMISDYYMLDRALFSPERKPKLAIVCFSPRDFMDNSLTSVTATAPFHFCSRFVSPDSSTDQFSLASLRSDPEWFLQMHLPARRLGQAALDSLSASLGKLKVSTDESAEHLRARATVKPERERIHTPLPFMDTTLTAIKPGDLVTSPRMPKIFIDNKLEYAKRYRSANPPGYRQELDYFEALLSNLEQQRIEVLAVNLPLMQSNREQLPERFWQDFRARVSSACEKHRALLMDLSDSEQFEKSDFVDTVHLNADGARQLAYLMAQRLNGEKELAGKLGKSTSQKLSDRVSATSGGSWQ